MKCDRHIGSIAVALLSRRLSISERSDNSKYKSRGFETLRDLIIRRIITYWNRALGFPLLIDYGSSKVSDIRYYLLKGAIQNQLINTAVKIRTTYTDIDRNRLMFYWEDTNYDIFTNKMVVWCSWNYLNTNLPSHELSISHLQGKWISRRNKTSNLNLVLTLSSINTEFLAFTAQSKLK